MNPPQYVYNLIAMSQSHIDAWERVRERDAEYSAMVKGMTLEERKAFGKKWRSENKHVKDELCFYGKAYRGSFLDLDALIKIIEEQDDVWGICEGYYTYLLIERLDINVIDPTCWGEDDQGGGEIWYKMDPANTGTFQYKRIDKPECFKQTFNFT